MKITNPEADVAQSSRRRAAGVTPTGPTHLAEFLETHGDDPGFTVHHDDEPASPLPLHTATVVSERSGPPVLEATGLAGERFSIPVADITLVSTAQHSPADYESAPETPAERATALRHLAAAHPHATRVSAVVGLLESGPAHRDGAIAALDHLAAVRPLDCTPAIPVIRSLIAASKETNDAALLGILRSIAETDPAALRSCLGVIRTAVNSDDEAVRNQAAGCLAALSDEVPGDVVPVIPDLGECVAADAGRFDAIAALATVAETAPAEIAPALDPLVAVAIDDDADHGERLNAITAIGRCLNERPDQGMELLDEIAPLLTCSEPKLRNNATALVFELAAVHTDVVKPHVASLAESCSVSDTYTRINATGALARVATDFPEAVAPATDALLGCLGDEDPRVRENACWALGRIRTPAAEGPLEDLARDDETATVRTRAQWALARLL